MFAARACTGCTFVRHAKLWCSERAFYSATYWEAAADSGLIRNSLDSGLESDSFVFNELLQAVMPKSKRL